MTPVTGYGQFYNGDAPWLRQKAMVVPDFSTIWGGSWNGNWGSLWNTTPTSIGSASSGTDYSKHTNETFDEYQERMYKEEKARALIRKDLRRQLNESETAAKEVNENIETLNKGKKSDGSAEILPDFKKMSFLDKTLRAVGNGFECVKNVAKTLVGFEKDGTWNPWKCLRNVATVVAVGALCAFAGPIGAAVGAKVGAVLLTAGVSASTAATATTVVATTIAATPTVLRAVGLASGTTLTAKGAVNTYKADTIEEFDSATQELGMGIMITAASLTGSKSKANTNQVQNALPNPSTTTTSTCFWISAKNFVSNPFKNAWDKAYTSQANARTIMDANGGGWQGFKAACKDVRLAPTREAKEQFEQQRNDMYQKFLDKYNKLAEQHRASNDPIEKMMIDLKGKGLYNQASKLYRASNKADFRLLKNASKDYIAELKRYLKTLKKTGEVEINGQKFTTADKSALKEIIKDVIKEQKTILDDVNLLTKSRFDSMLKMSRTSTYRAEAESFGFSNSHWYSRPSNWLQATWSKGVKKMDVVNVGLTTIDPAWFLQPYFKNPALMPFNTLACANPILQKSTGDIINAEDFKTQMAELESQKAQIEQLTTQLEKQIEASYA